MFAMKRFHLEKLRTKLKNNAFLAIVITMGTIIIALSTLTDALKNLIKTKEEIIGHPIPVDIDGRWRVENPEKTLVKLFDLGAAPLRYQESIVIQIN